MRPKKQRKPEQVINIVPNAEKDDKDVAEVKAVKIVRGIMSSHRLNKNLDEIT